MEIKINRDYCIGCGMCKNNVPEVFSLDDKFIAVANSANVTEENLEQVDHIINSCPGMAISRS